MSEVKRYWIYKGTSNFCEELIPDDNYENMVKQKPDVFYDIVSTADTIEGGVEVVLASDYEKLKVKLEEVEKIHEPVGRDTKNGFIELRQLVNMRYGLLIAPCGFKHECHFITAEDADWILEQKKIAYEKLKAQLEKAEKVLNYIAEGNDHWAEAEQIAASEYFKKKEQK